MNALLQLDEDQKAAGVVTHSSGNHAQALALAGQLLGVPVTIVMPRTAPAVKRAATEGYGARIVLCEPTLESREATVAAEIERARVDARSSFQRLERDRRPGDRRAASCSTRRARSMS